METIADRARRDPLSRAFRADFDRWRLELPARDVVDRRPGFIHQAGWLIQYVWGRDKRGEYLEYYAAHHMTDDFHFRIYASGRRQQMCWLGGMYLSSEDPEEARRLAGDHRRRQRRIARKLVARGFTRFTLDMRLNAGLVGQEPPTPPSREEAP